MSPMRHLRGRAKYALSLLIVLAIAFAAAVLAVVYPTNANMYYQTNGRSDPATIGDWYTTTASGSTDDIHRIVFEITIAQLASCGGTCTITVQDADTTPGAGPLDETAGPAEPARFQLRTGDGVTTLQSTTVVAGAANGTNVTFTVNAVGWYQITSETGDFPINGIGTANRNDDDNGFRIDVPFAGGLTGGLVGDRQTTFERDTATGTLTMYFLVGPAAGTTTLSLRNFDQDAGTGVTYTRPGGGTVAGTMSANGVWNNGGTINTGADTVVATTTIGTGAVDAGIWTYTYTGWGVNNQTIFEALAGGARLNTFHTPPLRAGSFTMTAPTTLSTNIGTAVDHAFSVTNTFNTTDIINFTTTGTAVNWTATILTSGGAALPDTDGNGQPDTGIMASGATANYILRVTPNAGAIGSSVTTVNGVSWMDNRVDSANNTTVSLVKTTWLRPLIAKAFSPTSMTTGSVSTITFTLTNRNTTALTNLAFTDTYPAGLVNRTPLTVGGTCVGVTTTAAAGGGTFNVTAGTVPAGSPGSCTITVQVTTPTMGTYNNTTSGASGVISGTAIVAGPASNTATLTVVPILTATKSFALDPVTSPGVSTLTLTFSNPNAFALTGLAFTDTFPVAPGAMTVAAPLTTVNTCGGALTDSLGGVLAAGDVGIRLTGGTVPLSGSCIVSVIVRAVAPGVYTNTIAASGITTTQGATNAAAVSDTLTVLGPSLTVVKSSVAYSDPFNNLANPKRIPGGFVTYNVLVTNTGPGAVDLNTVVVLDAIPPNTDLFVGNMGGVGSGPVAFLNGVPSSGLTYTFTSLASATDDVSFSSNGGVSFLYTPAPNANNVDPNVTHIRINPKGTMPGNGGGNPSFQVSFRVRVE